jgi:GNAT superfamily N-acetyltransferase
VSARPVDDIVLAWCCDPAVAAPTAALFAAHAEPSYISHSELQFGRAITLDAWAKDLQERVRHLAEWAVAAPPDAIDGMRLATLTNSGRLEGFAFVRFVSGPTPYATLEDLLIVPDGRSRRRGARFVAWIVEECRTRGMQRLFLESGVLNQRAHDFFERQGFRQTSIVMMRDL